MKIYKSILMSLSVAALLTACGSDSNSSDNHTPVANAGDDLNGSVSVPMNLSGIQSNDADNDPLTYQWYIITKPENSAATLTNASEVNASLTPDMEGEYVVALKVNDGSATSSPDYVTCSAYYDEATFLAFTDEITQFASDNGIPVDQVTGTFSDYIDFQDYIDQMPSTTDIPVFGQYLDFQQYAGSLPLSIEDFQAMFAEYSAMFPVPTGGEMPAFGDFLDFQQYLDQLDPAAFPTLEDMPSMEDFQAMFAQYATMFPDPTDGSMPDFGEFLSLLPIDTMTNMMTNMDLETILSNWQNRLQ